QRGQCEFESGLNRGLVRALSAKRLASFDRVQHGSRAVLQGLCKKRDDRRCAAGVFGTPGVDKCPLERSSTVCPESVDPVWLAPQPPGLRKPEIVAEVFEQGNR